MPHPWHDVPIGDEAPQEFTALIEILKGSGDTLPFRQPLDAARGEERDLFLVALLGGVRGAAPIGNPTRRSVGHGRAKREHCVRGGLGVDRLRVGVAKGHSRGATLTRELNFSKLRNTEVQLAEFTFQRLYENSG